MTQQVQEASLGYLKPCIFFHESDITLKEEQWIDLVTLHGKLWKEKDFKKELGSQNSQAPHAFSEDADTSLGMGEGDWPEEICLKDAVTLNTLTQAHSLS